MDFSLWQQVDGLMWAILRCRLERDVFASGWGDSVCEVFGWEAHRSCAAFCGLYFRDLALIPEAVAFMATHRGSGAFLVPVVPGAPPLIRERGGGEKPWFDFLMAHSQLVIDVPVGALRGRYGLVPLTVRLVVVVASFGNGKLSGFARKRRPERRIAVEVIPSLSGDGPRLGPIPVLLHRVSPMADELGPTEAGDTAPRDSALYKGPVENPPVPMRSKWPVKLFEGWCEDYPDVRARDLGLTVMRDELDTFVGDRTKAVNTAPIEPTKGKEFVLRNKFVEMRDEEQKMAGPYKSVPYPNARVTPAFDIPKDKRNPDDERIRPIYHFSVDHQEEGGGLVGERSVLGAEMAAVLSPAAAHS